MEGALLENSAPLIREVLLESLSHTAAMLPVLFGVFLLMELVSHGVRTGWISRVARHPVAGPVAASALGLLPQCGFSVAITLLWAQGLAPTGFLVASYIATSDEAIPVLLSSPSTVSWVLPLMAAKLGWGMAVGVIVNLVLDRGGAHTGAEQASSLLEAGRESSAGTVTSDAHRARPYSGVGERSGWKGYVVHAMADTGRTAATVFALSSALGFAGRLAGPSVTGLLPGPGFWQPLAASVVGLIPTCAISVGLAEGFRSGLISFPALLSGLTANAGMGLLVLAKESRDPRRTASVISILLASAFIAGCLANLLLPA